MDIGKVLTMMTNKTFLNAGIVYSMGRGLLFFLSFVLIFFQLGKAPLGNFREENHPNSLEKEINWITIKNDFLKSPMHYNYQNYHEYRYSTIVQNILERNAWLKLEVKNGGTFFKTRRYYDRKNHQCVDFSLLNENVSNWSFPDPIRIPSVNRDYFHKGPVYFWLAAGVSKVIGFTRFSVRFWPALLGFGSIFLCYLLTKEIFDKYTALGSVFILSTTFQFLHVDGARAVSIDTIFSFFLVAVIYSLIMQKKYPKLFYLAAVFLALAGLTRSILMIIPLVAVFFLIDFLIVSETGVSDNYIDSARSANLVVYKKGVLKKNFKKWAIGLIIIFSIFSPWVILQYHYGGQDFIRDVKRFQIKEEFKEKLVLATKEVYPKFQYNLFLSERPLDREFYPWTIFKGAFPWSIFAILAFLYNLKLAFQEKKRDIFVILGVIAAILCFVYIKAQNWARYMLDIYPFLAILVAKLLSDFCYIRKDVWLRLGMLGTFLFFRDALVPFNFNPVWLGSAYTGILFVALFGEFFFKHKKISQMFSWGIIAHFGMVAVINILQPFFNKQ